MGTKQAAFPGAGAGLGPPPGRAGLGADAGPWGGWGVGVTLARVGRALAGRPQAYSFCLVLSKPASPSLETLLSVYTEFLPLCSSHFQGSSGVVQRAGIWAEPPQPSVGRTCACRPWFCAVACPFREDTTPGSIPALTAFITIIIKGFAEADGR